MIDTPVAITLIICGTLIALAYIGDKGKGDGRDGTTQQSPSGGGQER